MDATILAHLPVLSTYSVNEGPYSTIQTLFGNATALSNAWPATNRAIYIPFNLRSNYLVRAVWWINGGTASGNVDCGVYSGGGTLITNTGSTAQSGTNTLQSVTLGTAVLLNPGSYFLALVLSSATGTIWGINGLATRFLSAAGVTQQAIGALPLPNSYTPATNAFSFFPIFGIATVTTL